MSRSLSIVHVIYSFEVGGGERVAIDIADGQQRAGNRVCVVSLSPPPDGPMAELCRQRELTTHTVPKLGPAIDPTLILRLALLYRRRRASIVHTHNPLPLIYATLPGRLAGCRVVHTKHGLNQGSARRLWLQRQGARFADAYVAVSETTAEQARAHHDCPRARLSVVENGIQLDGYGPNSQLRAQVRAELAIPEHACVVGTVGRIHEDKNHALLVRAMAELIGPSTRLVIVGDGPELERLQLQVAQLPHREFIHLLGRRMDVPRLLPAFDIFAMSSTTEGLPLVVPEAMATGLPVVSTAVGGIPGVVKDGETGYLVSAGDEAALRERIGALCTDRNARERMGSSGRAIALTHYSAQRMVSEYMDLYHAL